MPPGVRFVDADDALLERAWPTLQRTGPQNPFTSWEWFSAMASAGAADGRLRVACALRGDEVVGLLPLELVAGRLGSRVLRLPGAPWLGLDHIDVVAAPGRAAEAAEAIGAALRARRDWDVLDLDALAPGAALGRALAVALRFPEVVWRAEETSACSYVDLRPPDGGPVVRSSGLRGQIRRGLRDAAAAGGGFSVAREPAEAVAYLDELMLLHDARFGSESQVFATPQRREFHRAACHRLAAAGRARVYRLEMHGRSAALLYALVAGDRLLYYSTGLDPAAEGSPGRTLLGQTAIDAAAEGFREFDLLRGDHVFKQRLATAERDDVRIRLWRSSPRGAAVLARGHARTAARRLADSSRRVATAGRNHLRAPGRAPEAMGDHA